VSINWEEKTVIQPSAWSPRVEWDLLQSLYRQGGERTAFPDLSRHQRGDWTVEELASAGTFEADVASAYEEVRLHLDNAPAVPHEVVFGINGVHCAPADLGELADRERQLVQRGISGGATTPTFAATPAVGSGLVPATLDTSLTAPSNTTTILTGVAAGTKIEEVVVMGVGTTVAAVVNLFLYDGTTYHLHDQVLISAVTSSTTAIAFRVVRQYTNLILKDNTWLYKTTVTVAGDQSMLKVTATAGALT
jgi:hypothetical protein